jgi:hypothetical protein
MAAMLRRFAPTPQGDCRGAAEGALRDATPLARAGFARRARCAVL